jgi:hypothetical protein
MALRKYEDHCILIKIIYIKHVKVENLFLAQLIQATSRIYEQKKSTHQDPLL